MILRPGFGLAAHSRVDTAGGREAGCPPGRNSRAMLRSRRACLLEPLDCVAAHRWAVAEDCDVEPRLGEAGQTGAGRCRVGRHHPRRPAYLTPSSGGGVTGKEYTAATIHQERHV